jgi:hypothetical protein
MSDKYMMLYHTTFRNIGLFTSLSLALLSQKNVIFDLISLSTSLISLLMNIYILNDFNDKQIRNKGIQKWNELFKIMRVVNLFLFGIVIYRVYTDRDVLYNWFQKFISPTN